MADRYLLESSTVDGYLLEDGSGVYLLEVSAPAGIGASYPQPYKPSRHQRPRHPGWAWLRDHAVGVWPFWERGEKRLYNIAGQVPSLDIVGATWQDRVYGPALRFDGAGLVDTGYARLGTVGLFAASTERWTAVIRCRVDNNTAGTTLSRSGAVLASRTFNLRFNRPGSAAATPTFDIRGTGNASSWNLDDDTFHTIWVVWDGSACIAYYDNAQGALALTVGTAVEETAETIGFGANRLGNPANFLSGDIDFAAILDIPLSPAQIIAWHRDLLAPWRPQPKRVARPAAAVLVTPGIGALTLTGLAPTISHPVVAGVGGLTLTGLAPTLPVQIIAGLGVLTLTGFAPAMPQVITPGIGTLTLTGLSPSILIPIATGKGDLLLNGLAPTVTTAGGIQTQTGALLLDGLAPSIPHTVVADVGALILTGLAPTVRIPTVVQPGIGALTLTGLAPTIVTSAAPVAPPADVYAWFPGDRGKRYEEYILEKPKPEERKQPKKHRHPLRIPRALRPIPTAPAVQPPAQPVGDAPAALQEPRPAPIKASEAEAPPVQARAPEGADWREYADIPYTAQQEIEDLELMLAAMMLNQ